MESAALWSKSPNIPGGKKFSKKPEFMKLEIISLKQSSCVINIPLGGRLAKNAEHSEHTIKSGDL